MKRGLLCMKAVCRKKKTYRGQNTNSLQRIQDKRIGNKAHWEICRPQVFLLITAKAAFSVSAPFVGLPEHRLLISSLFVIILGSTHYNSLIYVLDFCFIWYWVASFCFDRAVGRLCLHYSKRSFLILLILMRLRNFVLLWSSWNAKGRKFFCFQPFCKSPWREDIGLVPGFVEAGNDFILRWWTEKALGERNFLATC